MPPAISDDESDSGFVATLPRPARKSASKFHTSDDEIESEEEGHPARFSRGKKAAAPIVVEEDEEEEKEEVEEEGNEEETQDGDNDDDELDDDEFIVENILDHMVDQGEVKFQVKWEGYDDPSDITWEPEATLREGAESILEEYLSQKGGIEKILEEAAAATKSKKRGRQSSSAAAKSEKAAKKSRKTHPLESPAPAPVKAKEWHPPNGSWEDHIQAIDVFQEQDSATGKAKLVVYLNWKNGRKTKHTTEMVYKRCPQKMLRFYENHVRILQNPSDEN
ncbi:hypothetical protein TD95_005371 [Thielaviopsis punctulata]|uniref:Chromo domain-containing protein n=1 Tax=Thielaviopsis punctulata TaxID=72032 RepID=A0A0F4ZHE5_9PEZI|nr:hypothetical protein TD95_005371 [Thielaviopsis punctulata]